MENTNAVKTLAVVETLLSDLLYNTTLTPGERDVIDAVYRRVVGVLADVASARGANTPL